MIAIASTARAAFAPDAAHHRMARAVGQRLPSAHALAGQFGVNRHTIRRSLASLSSQGLSHAIEVRNDGALAEAGAQLLQAFESLGR